MAEQTEGQEQTQTAQQEEQTSQQTQPQQQESFDKDKFFRGAYNEGKSKAQKDALEAIKSQLGVDGEFESIDEAVAAAADKIKPKEETKNELEELQKMLQQTKQEKERVQKEYQDFKRQQTIDSTLSKAIGEVKRGHELSIKEDHLKKLFQYEYNVKTTDDGSTYVERSNGTPVLDGDGNRQSVGKVLESFVTENSYAQQKAEGTGGGTGGGGAASKPKYSEFKELINSNKAGDKQRASEIWQKAHEGGWDEKDSPKTYNPREELRKKRQQQQ